MFAAGPKPRCPYAAVVTFVQVVEPVVFTYSRVDVDDPSVRMYSEPCAAASVGAPEPKKIPRLETLDISKPAPATPPAGTAVPEKAATGPVADTEAAVTGPLTSALSSAGSANATPIGLVFGMIAP
jgi:hypothetical protein